MLKKISSIILLILLTFNIFDIRAYGEDNNTTTETAISDDNSENIDKIESKNEDNTNKEDKEVNILEYSNSGNVQRSYKNPPGTFSGGYDFMTDELLNIIKANLVVSDSFLQMENNFKIGNLTSFEEDYLDVISMIKNDKSITEEQREEYLKVIDTPEIKYIVSKVLYGIVQMEHHGDIKSNPGNNYQGIFQLVQVETCGVYGKCRNYKGEVIYNQERVYYTPQSKYLEVYGKGKIVNKQNFLYQMADFMYFLGNEKSIGFRIRQLSMNEGPIIYKEQLAKILEAYNDDLNLNEKETQKLINDIIRKDTGSVGSFINAHKKELYQYGIVNAEDMFIWLDYIKVAMIGNYYNGHYNNLTWVYNNPPKSFYAPIYNVFDHSYVSNAQTYDFCFNTIKTDGGAMAGAKHGDGLIMHYLKYNYPNLYQEKQLAFSAMIGKMKEKKLLKGYANSCK